MQVEQYMEPEESVTKTAKTDWLVLIKAQVVCTRHITMPHSRAHMVNCLVIRYIFTAINCCCL